MASAESRARANRAFLIACSIRRREEWEGCEDDLRDLDGHDWDSVAAHAERHGFVGLLARNLAWAEERTGVRFPITVSMAAAQRAQLMQLLPRKAAAVRIARALCAEGIPVASFKGIVLAEEVYGDLSLRGFRDYDAMVPRERLDRACTVAFDLGYRLTLFDDVQEHVRAGAHAAGMIHRDGTGFDLHWSLAPDLTDPRHDANVWKRCVPAPAGASLPGMRLGPELTLIHLAKHFHSHQYGEIKPLVDFAAAWKHSAGGVDAGELARAARELDLLPVLEVVQALRERSFEPGTIPVPRAGSNKSATARIAHRLVTDDFMLNSSQRSRVGNWVRYLLTSGSVAASVRSLVDMLVPGRLHLSRFFDRPFRASMYPYYYWRQVVKVVTLARK